MIIKDNKNLKPIIDENGKKEYFYKEIENSPNLNDTDKEKKQALIVPHMDDKCKKIYYEGLGKGPWYMGNGETVYIVNYINKDNIIIEFKETGYKTVTTTKNLFRRNIKDSYCKGKFGQYLGEVEFDTSTELHDVIRNKWKNLFRRVYGFNLPGNESYIKSAICMEWYNFSNFAYWMYYQYGKLNLNYIRDYQIDKDIKQWNNEYKMYCPETCLLIPSKLNSLLATLTVCKRISFTELPLGVCYYGNNRDKFYVENIFQKPGEMKSILFDDPMEAFECYKNMIMKKILIIGENYLKENRITEETFNLLHNIEIKPFQKQINIDYKAEYENTLAKLFSI